jgi:hypothetical protein
MAVWSATLLAGPPSRAPPQQASSRGPWWRRPTAGPITVASDIGLTNRGRSMMTRTVSANRGLRALSALVALLVFSTLLVFSSGEPAFAHDEGWSTRLYDSRGNVRGIFSYGHHTGSQNVFSLGDYSGDNYNVSVTIQRKSGTSWVTYKAMSATNQTTRFYFCVGGEMRFIFRVWVISDGLSSTETQYRIISACH